MKISRPCYIIMARSSFFLFPVLFFIYQAEFTLEQNSSPEEKDQNTQGNAIESTITVDEGSTADILPPEKAPEFTFVVRDEADGKICILAKFTATFTITYSSEEGDQKLGFTVRPEDPKINTKGRCGTLKQEPKLELSWPGFKLTLIFTTRKEKGKAAPDSWELMIIELIYNTKYGSFDGASNPGLRTVRNLENNPLFRTPFGNSYYCPSPEVIPMYKSKNERLVLLRLQEISLQAYDVQNGKFGPPKRCGSVKLGGVPEPFAQDETVPIAVGSTLAVMAVIVVIGYALWRNMAVRKTDYSYME